MKNSEDRAFFTVCDIAERDLDYLTDLRDRIKKPPCALPPEEIDAIRRLYIRVFVTMVEGSVAAIKNVILHYSEQLNDAERAVLRDVTFDLNEKGVPYERPLRPPILSSLKFAFRIFASVHKLSIVPDYRSSGWQAMKNVIELRNRLTHPKTPNDLKVTDTDLKSVDEAEIWLRDNHGSLLKAQIMELKTELATYSDLHITPSSSAATPCVASASPPCAVPDPAF